jgi:hypothetical protein
MLLSWCIVKLQYCCLPYYACDSTATVDICIIMLCHVSSSRGHRPLLSTCRRWRICLRPSPLCLPSPPACCRRRPPRLSPSPRRPTRGTGSVWPLLPLCRLSPTRRTIRATRSHGMLTGRGSARSEAGRTRRLAGRPPRRSVKRETSFHSFLFLFQ